jgi:hypothetical protein
MSKIDWSEAPDDCLGAVHLKEEYIYRDVDYGIFVTKTKGMMCDGYHYCGHTCVGPQIENYNFTPRPDKAPIFTQAMSDAGELPSVGMECLVFNVELMNPAYEKATIDFLGCHVVVYSSESCTERTCNLEFVKFKHIDARTDSEKAIDDLRNADDRICNDTEWHKNFLDLIKAGKIHEVSFAGKS